MLNKRIGLLALGVLSATQAMANDQADAKGFVEDSHLNVLARNAYISRDYKNHKQDKAEWGQGFLGTFSSGFTQGTVGVGVDAFGIYALRLDGGRGKSGAGDGGNTILLANSYWSDFNAKDERSWQLGYGFDFGAVGIPGLTYNIAYVRGTNIDDGSDRGRGTEREIYNQAKYVVQSGPVKDLSVRVRGSWLRVSNNADKYNKEGNELRVFVDYPINVF